MKNSKLDYKIIKEFLNEEEDDNIFGDEEAKDEPEEAAEETEDAEATDEEGGEEDAEEKEGEDEAEEQPQDPKEDDSSFLDSEIESVLIDFETKARGEAQSEDAANESFVCKGGLSLLVEQEAPSAEIDIEVFASEVARLVKNYDTLLDMKSLLITKAKKYIEDRYDLELSDHLSDLLDTKHGLTDEEEKPTEEAPLGLGAIYGGSGA